MAAYDTVLFVSRDKIDISFGGNIFSLPLVPAVVKDIDVVDNEAFKTNLASFADKNQISLGTCAILLSESVCFISEKVNTKNTEESLASFLSTLPFDNPVARILGDKIVGTNKALYQTILEVIAQKGGRVRMISPIFLSKEMSGKKTLDGEMVKYISENEDSYLKATFTYEAPIPVSTKVQTEVQPPKRSRRELILMGVFAALIVGLAIFLLVR